MSNYLRGNPNSLQSLFNAEDNVRRYKAEFNAASVALELSKIRQRAARLRSQAEPLNTNFPDREQQELVLEAIWYVLYGTYDEKWGGYSNS
jgi:hypothetical protein